MNQLTKKIDTSTEIDKKNRYFFHRLTIRSAKRSEVETGSHRVFQRFLILILFISFTIKAMGQDTAIVPQVDHPEVYIQVTNDRAERIVREMDIEDPSRAERVKEMIAQQYRDLSAIHDTRDAQIEAIEKNSDDKAEDCIQLIRKDADKRVGILHDLYLSKLSSELTLEQIDQVKDGMTYGVVQLAYKGYLTLLPDLTGEQKQTIMDYLAEAREYAMDAGSSDEKHGWFRKYKGMINNYLSDEGYNLNEAEERIKDRKEE